MPTMIYTDDNECAVVDDSTVPAYLANGWHPTPQGDIYNEPPPFKGSLALPETKAQKRAKTPEQE